MFFSKLLKFFLINLGFLLIGFGIGMIINENFQIEGTNHLLIVICLLILGGFLIALGIAKNISKPPHQKFSSGGEKEAVKGESPIKTGD